MAVALSMQIAGRFLPDSLEEHASEREAPDLADRYDFRYETLDALARGSLPFTAAQDRIFSESRQIATQTQNWLGIRGYATIACVGLLSSLAVIPFSKDEDNGTKINVATAATITALCATTLGFLGLWITGTLPDKKSDAANREQNVLNALKCRYDDAAVRLIELFHSKKPEKRDKATRIATAIDVDRIAQMLQENSTQPINCDYHLGPLKESVKYVRHMLTHPVEDHSGRIPLSFRHSIIEQQIKTERKKMRRATPIQIVDSAI
jgi:hypothetical protein